MEIEDKILREKDLRLDAAAVAEAITDYLKEQNRESFIGFAVFIFDTQIGTLQYISDMDREYTSAAIKAWVDRGIQ